MANTFDIDRKNPSIQNLSVKITIDERTGGILDSQDIQECWFIEDICSFCMYGKIVFYDNVGLVENGPLTGNEMLSFVYGVEEVREVVFHIQKVKNIVQVSNTDPTDVALIEILFTDSSYYNMTVPKYSRSFGTKTKYTNIIQHLLKNMIGWTSGSINIEESKNSIDSPWVMPYWNVSDSIKWLLKRSIGSVSRTSGYLCYNNTYNNWSPNIYTLNYLFSENNIVDDQDYVFQGGNENTQNKIYEWWINGVDHQSLDIVRGGKFRGFDPSQKKLIEKEYKFTDGLKDSVLMGKKSILSDISDTKASQMSLGETTEADLQSVLYHEWVRKYSLQNMLNIIVQGNEKRYAGHQITIKWRSIDKIEKQWQKQLEGKWLVKSITHNFVGKGTSNENYMQRIVLIKNAFQDSDAKSLINATKTNLTEGKRKKIILDI